MKPRVIPARDALSRENEKLLVHIEDLEAKLSRLTTIRPVVEFHPSMGHVLWHFSEPWAGCTVHIVDRVPAAFRTLIGWSPIPKAQVVK